MAIIKKISARSGLILTEALLAISLLTIGGIALGTILNNAVQIMAISKNYMIAQNLATEAIEGVKNVRDTNRLIHPQNPELWLCMVPKKNCAGTETARDHTKNYIISNTAGPWALRYSTSNDDLVLENYTQRQEDYRLWLMKMDTAAGAYLKYVTADNAKKILQTPYYRRIKFLHIDPTNQSASFEVKVQWYEGAKMRTIERTVVLNNYF